MLRHRVGSSQGGTEKERRAGRTVRPMKRCVAVAHRLPPSVKDFGVTCRRTEEGLKRWVISSGIPEVPATLNGILQCHTGANLNGRSMGASLLCVICGNM